MMNRFFMCSYLCIPSRAVPSAACSASGHVIFGFNSYVFPVGSRYLYSYGCITLRHTPVKLYITLAHHGRCNGMKLRLCIFGI
jgi:hypothetical protein